MSSRSVSATDADAMKLSNTSCSRSVSQRALSRCPHWGTYWEGATPASTCRFPNRIFKRHVKTSIRANTVKDTRLSYKRSSSSVQSTLFHSLWLCPLVQKLRPGKRSRGVDSVFGCLKPVGTCTTQLKKGCLLRFLSFCVDEILSRTACLVHHPPPWPATQARPYEK